MSPDVWSRAQTYMTTMMPDPLPLPPGEDNSPVKILVIEDEPMDQEMLISQLQDSGIHDRVLCIDNGHDAMTLLREGAQKLTNVCAIFLDLSLPGVHGLLLLQTIRSNIETALLPVFIMSGSTNPKDEAEARRLGATDFIPKRLVSEPSFRETIADIFQSPR
jgi:CheY-like chemotaxis protein